MIYLFEILEPVPNLNRVPNVALKSAFRNILIFIRTIYNVFISHSLIITRAINSGVTFQIFI